MNDRIVTLACAVGVLLLAAGLILPRGSGPLQPASRPTSYDTGAPGLAAAARWLQQSGVPVIALRDRYFELPKANAAATGNLLVVTEPSVYPPRPGEVQTLKDWIGRGNDILLLESLASRPAWTLASRTAPGESDLLGALGLARSAPPKDPDAVCQGTTPATDTGRLANAPALLKPHPSDIHARAVRNVREVRIKPEADGTRPEKSPDITYSKGKDREVMDWLCDQQRGRSALRQFRLGEGRVWVSSYPQLFANGNLGIADNAQLLANLVEMSVTGEHGHLGAVIFDDMHQGDSSLYDPAAFFSDPRLHASLWLLVAIWLLYLLGYSNRFAKPLPPSPGITPSRFVESLGGFLARHLGSADGADRMLQDLHRELARRSGASASSATLMDLLSGLPGLDPALLQQLHTAEARVRTGNGDLRPLARVIYSIRKQLK